MVFQGEERKTLSRQELYDLVWSKPMRELAKEFGLSDQGLAKKCKRHNIPRPPQGYWLKKEQDRKPLVTPLPVNNDPYLEDIDFYPSPESLKKSLKAKSDLSDEQLAAALEYKFPDKVTRYHPVIALCRKDFKKTRLDNYSRIVFGRDVADPGFKVTPDTFDRACLFLQGLIDLFSTYGWKFKKEGKSAFFEHDGNKLKFEIKEPVTQKPNTDANGSVGIGGRLWPSHIYTPTGKLEFRLVNTHSAGYKKNWYDSENAPIESQLGSIVQGFSRGFEDVRLWAIEREEWNRKWEQEQAERKEQARISKIEENRRKYLFDLAEQYNKVESIRDFLAALERAENKPEGLAEWLEWANTVLNELDPLSYQEEIIDEHQAIAEKTVVYGGW